MERAAQKETDQKLTEKKLLLKLLRIAERNSARLPPKLLQSRNCYLKKSSGAAWNRCWNRLELSSASAAKLDLLFWCKAASKLLEADRNLSEDPFWKSTHTHSISLFLLAFHSDKILPVWPASAQKRSKLDQWYRSSRGIVDLFQILGYDCTAVVSLGSKYLNQSPRMVVKSLLYFSILGDL